MSAEIHQKGNGLNPLDFIENEPSIFAIVGEIDPKKIEEYVNLCVNSPEQEDPEVLVEWIRNNTKGRTEKWSVIVIAGRAITRYNIELLRRKMEISVGGDDEGLIRDVNSRHEVMIRQLEVVYNSVLGEDWLRMVTLSGD